MSKHGKKDWHQFKEEHASHDEDIEESAADVEPKEAALDHPSYESLEQKLTQVEQQAHENWEKSVRALAELDNVRRRSEREIANAHRYGQEKLLSSLLPVVDSLEQAIQLVDSGANNAMREGLELTMKQFLDVLKKAEVEQLDPLGHPFNPQEHEAMSMQEAPNAEPNSVIAVFQKGYKLGDRIIRPARVIVSKNK